MKRVQAFCLAVLMFALCVATPASFYAETAATLRTSSASVKPGETATVTLTLENNPGIFGLVVTPQYNTDVLTLTTAAKGDIFTLTFAKNLVWDSDENVTDDGLLATLTFTVAETAPAGEYPVQFKVQECYNEDLDDVEISVISGTVTVTGEDPTIPEQFTQTVSLAEKDEFGSGKATGNAFEIAGVQIRTEGTPGLRFAARLSENLLQEVTDAYGEEKVSYGILLQLTDSVGDNLTEANINGKTIGKGGAVAVEGVKTYLKYEDAGYFYYTAVITDIPESFYETKITARAYVKVGNTYYFADETDGTSYDVPGASAVGGGYSVSLMDAAKYIVTNKITGWEAVQEIYGAGGEE